MVHPHQRNADATYGGRNPNRQSTDVHGGSDGINRDVKPSKRRPTPNQTLRKAYTILILAVLTNCPGTTAIVFDHPSMSPFFIEELDNTVVHGWQIDYQDEQILLDSCGDLSNRSTKSRLHHCDDSTFFLPAMAGDSINESKFKEEQKDSRKYEEEHTSHV